MEERPESEAMEKTQITSQFQLGLCCMFRDQPIQFRTTTATSIGKLAREAALKKLSDLCLGNACSTLEALRYCSGVGISCFRINSQILPLKTHPLVGYQITELPDFELIVAKFKECGAFSREHGLRTCFHPDQFVVLNSQREEVIERSLLELEYQAEVAEWVGADVLNIHAGGAYGDKTKALDVFASTVEDRVPKAVRKILTVENDDITYTPEDLLPLCDRLKIPLVYDVHHHRCRPDALSVEEATEKAIETWKNAENKRRPLFHISSPLDGWKSPKPHRHHDMIDPEDFPLLWRSLDITVEVEAKAKEVAVLSLFNHLRAEG